ncbi:Uncharacterized protein SCF082_LOCUS16933 [Durusdinium trenchii]|uniref:Uncharacterized protein n=1 Tax=Durusdinium trenchii TaxID=1381693 RepID=A0ABP0KE96_9DINO
MKPKLPVKLDLSYRASNGDASTFDWSEVPEGVLPYEEIDFSYNGITSAELDRVLEVCSRCPKLRVLKLFKNSIDDSGAEGLAELCRQSPKIEEIHLSHNMFTAEGASVIIIAAEACRQPDTVPLWLRLEQNHIDDAENVFRRLQDRYSVCRRIDPKACTSRTCVKKCLVHLPHFCLQRLSHVDSHPDLPQLAKSGATNGNNGNHALPRQMMRQFREDLDRQRRASPRASPSHWSASLWRSVRRSTSRSRGPCSEPSATRLRPRVDGLHRFKWSSWSTPRAPRSFSATCATESFTSQCSRDALTSFAAHAFNHGSWTA